MNKNTAFRFPPLVRTATAVLLVAAAVINPTTGDVMEYPDPASMTGASETEVRAQLGEPDASDEFVIDNNLREFRIELFNYVTPEQVAAANMPIRELTWTMRVGQAITLWLSRSDNDWKVLHGLVWQKDADF